MSIPRVRATKSLYSARNVFGNASSSDDDEVTMPMKSVSRVHGAISGTAQNVEENVVESVMNIAQDVQMEEAQLEESQGDAGDNPNIEVNIHNQSVVRSVASFRTTDEEKVVAEEDYVIIKENNCVLNLDSDKFRDDQKIVLEILKEHPFKKWFIRHHDVPLQYLQQWWANLYLENDEITSNIGGVSLMLDLSTFRSLLHLPEKGDISGKTDFDEIADSEKIIEDLKRLGYLGEMKSLSGFRRINLPPVWYCLFSVINKCLTEKHGSQDHGTRQILQIFHGIVKNRHYDYARLIWEEIKTTLCRKKQLEFIPYQRYWQICIWRAMKDFPQIPRRASEETAPHFFMNSLKTNAQLSKYPNHKLLSIAWSYVPWNNKVLRDYCISMGLPEPVNPTQETTHENVRGQKKWKLRVRGRMFWGKNILIVKRGKILRDWLVLKLKNRMRVCHQSLKIEITLIQPI